jgi:hypothetical protein
MTAVRWLCFVFYIRYLELRRGLVKLTMQIALRLDERYKSTKTLDIWKKFALIQGVMRQGR